MSTVDDDHRTETFRSWLLPVFDSPFEIGPADRDGSKDKDGPRTMISTMPSSGAGSCAHALNGADGETI